LIPKGWKVLPLFRNIHHNADIFSDPGKFDPSRFEVAPKPNTFMPFGSGIHSCPGNELAKLEISVLIHHLTTKYRLIHFYNDNTSVGIDIILRSVSDKGFFVFRWSIVGPSDGIQYGPFALPQNGLPIALERKP